MRLAALFLALFLATSFAMSNVAGSSTSSVLDSQSARFGEAGGRLRSDVNGAGADYLVYAPFASATIEINDELVDISTPFSTNLGADNLLDVDGTALLTKPAVSTLYYVYCSNSSASYAPLSIRLCETPPDNGSGPNAWSKIPYLVNPSNAGASNGKNWRYLGQVRTNASTQIVDTPQHRWISNYYNRRPAHLFSNPAFDDGNAQTTFNFASASYAIVHADAYVDFVSEDEQGSTGDERIPIVDVSAVVVITAKGAAVGAYGLSLNSATQPNVASLVASGAANLTVHSRLVAAAAGFSTVRLLGVSGGAPVTDALAADIARSGAAADVPATCIVGWVWQ